MVDENMRAVVRRLHSVNSEAVIELLEFDYALDELLRILEELTGSAQELHALVRGVAGFGEESVQQLDVAQDHSGRLHARTTQILAAFRMLRAAVKSWDIAEARRPSTNPSPSGNSSPAKDS